MPNPSKQMLLVSFWATWCGSCIAEFADLEDTYRMYSVRDLGLVTVSTNMPDETNTVMKLLEKMHATSRNLLLLYSVAVVKAAFVAQTTVGGMKSSCATRKLAVERERQHQVQGFST